MSRTLGGRNARVDSNTLVHLGGSGNSHRLWRAINAILDLRAASTHANPDRPIRSTRGIHLPRERRWTDWPSTLFVMNVDGSNLHRLSKYPGGGLYAEADPAWSPDGSSLAYWSVAYGVTITNAAGGIPQSAFLEPAAFGTGSSPAWSPDGTTLAFNMARSDANPSERISVMSLQTGTTQRVILDAYDPTYSPDGKRIAFTSTRRQ